ncbi:MAG: DUF2723 domain-containing protein [Chitinophagaceae bacterium]
MNYRKINNLCGWLAGGIAFIVYLMTLEPTVSFWDCGEFLSCAYKLEVGHSPGAPLFMMLQRMFGIFVDKQHVAFAINSFSALMSALTILFLFWTITYFAKKLLVGKEVENPENNTTALIMGAGFVGALAYTFSDTFWFSAVEAEVYATSSFVTAISFWAALKWELVADQRHSDKWLLLIAYMVGLSVGIHLLNLLIVPAVGIIYYFRRYKVTAIGTLVAFVVGCAVLGFVQFGVLQGIPKLAFAFDKLFVNSFGMPFNTGAIILVLLIIAGLVWLLFYAKKKGNYLLHTSVLCLMFILIGFSSYIVPVIRSKADPAIDMTNPDDANRLLSYVNREQFGSQPLLFGPDYNSPMTRMEKTGDSYAEGKKNGKDAYIIVGKKSEPVFDRTRFFPRIWEYNQPEHGNFYKQYLGLTDNDEPTSGDNFRFFMGYQMNWMWWRYFMWNYSGRQNDFEGQGEAQNGNWITGIKFLDKGKVGDMDAMSDNYRDNKARNELYLLPFILGVLGLVYQFNRDKRNGFIVFLLFFFTGIAIGIYLNMPPLQPRERDYAFAGSTYAFAIWIGLGVLMVEQWLRKAVKAPSTAAVAATVICLLAVPVLMAAKEWDDHDRSEKTLARASAYNVLMSCDSNAVLFTYGDNDTYPLWYLQEVEGIRTDVRTINTSLLGIDWYIEQLSYKVNDADAVPMLWSRDKYLGDRSTVVYYVENPRIPKDRFFNLEESCRFMADDDPQNKQALSDGSLVNYIPSKNFFINSLPKEELVKIGLLPSGDTAKVSTDVRFSFDHSYYTKDQLAIMNIIAAVAKEGWKRPICFGGGLPGDNYLNLSDYLRTDGLVLRLVPFKYVDSATMNMPNREPGFVNVEKSLNLYNNIFQWGNADRKNVYFDEKNRLMFYAYRLGVARLAETLVAQGRNADAIKVLDKVMNGITEESMQYDRVSFMMAVAYTTAGAKDKGRNLAMKIAGNAEADVNWAIGLNESARNSQLGSLRDDVSLIFQMGRNMEIIGDPATGKELQTKANALAQKVQGTVGNILQ